MLEKPSKMAKSSLAKATTKPCPQVSHTVFKCQGRGMAPWPGQAVHGAGENGQGPVSPAHTPEPPHIPGRGPGTQTVLDTTCSSSRAGPAAVFSRRCCGAGTPPCPARNVRQEHSVSEQSRPGLYNSPSKARKGGVTRGGLPQPSFLHSKREHTRGQGRKRCPDPPPNITQEHTSSTTCPAHGVSLRLSHLLFH